MFLLGPENFTPFHNFSTFYGAKYFNSLYNSMLNCPEDNVELILLGRHVIDSGPGFVVYIGTLTYLQQCQAIT